VGKNGANTSPLRRGHALLSLGLLAGPTPAPMMRTLCPTRSAVRPTSRRSLEERRGRDDEEEEEEEEPALGSEAISLYCVRA
jgi:hypothetical protein